MAKEKQFTDPIMIRFEPGALDRAEALANRLSAPGMRYTRTDILRMAMMRGLDAMELEKPAAKARRR